MSMFIDDEKKELTFLIPNSEAPIEGQHKGIADRTVGSFYMSDRYFDCFKFLNGLRGDFYFDIGLCLTNAKKMLNVLKSKELADSFKYNLRPQFEAVDALEWYSKQECCNYYLIAAPTINEQKKYLKFDNNDQVYKLLKAFLLGDLTKLVIKRIGTDGFMVRIDLCDDFDAKISDRTVSKWKRDKNEEL